MCVYAAPCDIWAKRFLTNHVRALSLASAWPRDKTKDTDRRLCKRHRAWSWAVRGASSSLNSMLSLWRYTLKGNSPTRTHTSTFFFSGRKPISFSNYKLLSIFLATVYWNVACETEHLEWQIGIRAGLIWKKLHRMSPRSQAARKRSEWKQKQDWFSWINSRCPGSSAHHVHKRIPGHLLAGDRGIVLKGTQDCCGHRERFAIELGPSR